MKCIVDGSDIWVGFDLDKTLAYYDEWKGEEIIGDAIPSIVELLKYTIELGKFVGFEVRIFTARASTLDGATHVYQWLKERGFGNLKVTNQKDHGCRCIIDDRVIRCIPNEGKLVL